MIKTKGVDILVVDDEKKICEMFTKWLCAAGHRVKATLRGKKALSLVKKKHFDVVFLDIVMPGISAVEVLKKIRRISPETKVVIITGKLVDRSMRDKLRQKGASGFLQKPFKIEDITAITG
ncbi:MAG: response regulator [Candidatus Aminicenantes bacterium]